MKVNQRPISAYGGIGDFSKELSRAFTHGIVQANVSAFTGGDVGSAFLSSVISSGVGSGTNGLSKAGQLGVSALSGAGLSTAMNGGNFWENLAYSSAVVGLNHLMDKGGEKGYGKLHTDEKEAYNFMWNNAIKTGVEHSGFLLNEGVFVSDISGNTDTNGGNDMVRYKVKNGILKVNGKSYNIKGHLHTHQALDKLGGTNRGYGLSDDDRNFGYRLQKPIFAMARNNKVYGYDYLRYIGKTYSPFLDMNGFSTAGLLNGKNSLLKFLKK